MSQWIKAEDGLPKVDTNPRAEFLSRTFSVAVLVRHDNDGFFRHTVARVRFYDDGRWEWWNTSNVVEWMYIPE